MTHLKTITSVVGLLALSATPALAGSANGHGNQATPPDNQGTTHAQTVKTNTPGPKASLPAKAKAYGKYCQGESKRHVAGTPGTPFSKCVTAMAKVAHDQAGAKSACKTESKKKAAGADRSAFSICVSGAAKLKNDQQAS